MECNKQKMTEWIEKMKEMTKNKKATLFGGIVIGLAVVLIVLIVAMTKGYSVDLSETYDVKFDGLDGDGQAEIVINEMEQNNIKKELGKYAKNPDVIANFSLIEYEIAPNEGLSNGDTVKVVAKYSESFFEKYKIKIKNREKEFVVKDLVVPDEIDVFEGLTMRYEGISPFITCSFDLSNCEEFARDYVDFDTTKKFYRNGEKVEVVASYSKDACLKEKVKVIKEKNEYEIEDKGYYVESLGDIDLTPLNASINEQLKLEYDSADESFCGVELGWTNHYTGLKEEQKKDEICLVLRETSDFDEETPYNIYAVQYRDKIGVEHRSRGNEETFDTEIDVLMLATNLYVGEDKVLHYDDLIEVRAEEVESVSNLMSEYIKENQRLYKKK